MKPAHLILVVLLLVTASCQSTASDQLTVAAAASFSIALDEIIPPFKDSSGYSPTISLAATGQLAQQIENGAPFDVFLAADADHVDRLIQSGFILPQSRTVIVYGSLVVIADLELDVSINTLQDLTLPEIGRIVIANPEHAPYGQAALQALENSGVLSQVENRLIYAETVRQAAQTVESGNAQIGIVAASVVTSQVRRLFSVPQSLFDRIEQVAGIMANSSSLDRAEDFLSFLISPTAQAIFNEYGFEPAHPIED